MMTDVLILVRHHRTAPIPSFITHDVNFLGQESIRGAHHRSDVEIVGKIFDAYVKFMSLCIEIGHDRFKSPVAIFVHNVSGIAMLE